MLFLLFLTSAGSANARLAVVQTSATSCPSVAKDSKSRVLTIRGGSGGGEELLGSIDWRYFLAGGLCAATSHGLTTPIDVVKTKMQQMPEKYNKGVINAARSIVATEGAGFLLAGLAPTVVGYGIEGALKFGFYETFKKVFAHVTPHKLINLLLASVVAGSVAAIVLVS